MSTQNWLRGNLVFVLWKKGILVGGGGHLTATTGDHQLVDLQIHVETGKNRLVDHLFRIRLIERCIIFASASDHGKLNLAQIRERDLQFIAWRYEKVFRQGTGQDNVAFPKAMAEIRQLVDQPCDHIQRIP